MGDAKRRGTREERLKEAMSRTPVGQMQFGLLFDTSEFGQQALQRFRDNGPSEFRDSFFRQYDVIRSSGAQFFSFLGTGGFSGGTTMAAMDLNVLLDEVIPQMLDRALAKGGLCSFILGIDPALHSVVEAQINSLDPVLGPDGTLGPNARLRELLARSATPTQPALFGGKPIAFDHVVFKPEGREKFHAVFLPLAERWRVAGNAPMSMRALSPMAEVLGDGSLMLAALGPDEASVTLQLEPGMWVTREIGYADLRRQSQVEEGAESTLHHATAPSLLDLATHVGGTEVDPDLVQILDPSIFGRLSELMMRQMTSEVAPISARTTMFQQDDRSLVILLHNLDAEPMPIHVPAGQWRLLTPSERAGYEHEFERKRERGETDELVEALASRMSERRTPSVTPQDVRVVVSVYDKSLESLSAIRATFLTQYAGLTSHVDDWLASTDAYLVALMTPSGSMPPIGVADFRTLMGETLPVLARLVESPEHALFVCPGIAPDSAGEISRLWKALLDDPLRTGAGEDDTLVWLKLTRNQVENEDPSSTLEWLQLLIDRVDAPSLAGQLVLHIDGYADDPRELFEVPEVQAYFTPLWEKWPYWFFFLSPHQVILVVGAATKMPVLSSHGGIYEMRIGPDQAAAFDRGIASVKALLDERWKLPEAHPARALAADGLRALDAAYGEACRLARSGE